MNPDLANPLATLVYAIERHAKVWPYPPWSAFADHVSTHPDSLLTERAGAMLTLVTRPLARNYKPIGGYKRAKQLMEAASSLAGLHYADRLVALADRIAAEKAELEMIAAGADVDSRVSRWEAAFRLRNPTRTLTASEQRLVAQQRNAEGQNDRINIIKDVELVALESVT